MTMKVQPMATQLTTTFSDAYVQRLRDEMRSNRERFATMGVALVDGSRDDRIALQIDSRYPISVRPAFHAHRRRHRP